MSHDVVITGIEQLLASGTTVIPSTICLCWGGSDSTEIPGPTFWWGTGAGRSIRTTRNAGNCDGHMRELSKFNGEVGTVLRLQDSRTKPTASLS